MPLRLLLIPLLYHIITFVVGEFPDAPSRSPTPSPPATPDAAQQSPGPPSSPLPFPSSPPFEEGLQRFSFAASVSVRHALFDATGALSAIAGAARLRALFLAAAGVPWEEVGAFYEAPGQERLRARRAEAFAPAAVSIVPAGGAVNVTLTYARQFTLIGPRLNVSDVLGALEVAAFESSATARGWVAALRALALERSRALAAAVNGGAPFAVGCTRSAAAAFAACALGGSVSAAATFMGEASAAVGGGPVNVSLGPPSLLPERILFLGVSPLPGAAAPAALDQAPLWWYIVGGGVGAFAFGLLAWRARKRMTNVIARRQRAALESRDGGAVVVTNAVRRAHSDTALVVVALPGGPPPPPPLQRATSFPGSYRSKRAPLVLSVPI